MTKKQSVTAIIERYLASKAGSWSAATLKSERSRLTGVTLELLQDPAALYTFLKDERELAPYSLRTAFIRAGEVVEFAMSQGDLKSGENKVKRFMEERAKLFKHVYQKKHVEVTFEEAAQRIAKMENESSRARALELLFTGMRWAESESFEDGKVVAKGGATRSVALSANVNHVEYEANYTTFYRHLKKVGLTPHMLRKLCATKVVERGADVADLMKMFGWTNSNTAMIYVQAQKEKELVAAMAKLLPKESKNGKQVSSKVPKTRKGSAPPSRKPNARRGSSEA
jgi:integrase